MSEPRAPSAPLATLEALLRGHIAAGGLVANTVRADAFGFSTFGRTDTLDLFARHPLALSATPHVLACPQALAVVDDAPDGRCIGVFADLTDGVIARLWVAAASAADACCEAAVPVARDDFLSQLRRPCQGDAADHPALDAGAWPAVQGLGTDALAAVVEPRAASSSVAVVVRAFSAGSLVAALYTLRVQEQTAPRRAHVRWALATARRDVQGSVVHSKLALSDALPAPAPVHFVAQ